MCCAPRRLSTKCSLIASVVRPSEMPVTSTWFPTGFTSAMLGSAIDTVRMPGMVMGFSSSGAGLASGFVLAYAGMLTVLFIGLGCAVLALGHLAWVSVSEQTPLRTGKEKNRVDVRGTQAAAGAAI